MPATSRRNELIMKSNAIRLPFALTATLFVESQWPSLEWSEVAHALSLFSVSCPLSLSLSPCVSFLLTLSVSLSPTYGSAAQKTQTLLD